MIPAYGVVDIPLPHCPHCAAREIFRFRPLQPKRRRGRSISPQSVERARTPHFCPNCKLKTRAIWKRVRLYLADVRDESVYSVLEVRWGPQIQCQI